MTKAEKKTRVTKIAQMLRSHRPAKEIASRYDVSVQRVYQIAKSIGLTSVRVYK